ncbi:MAG: GNAT family N-acetyltransferase [Chitinophagaceae bacterium]|nr:GNAT family N-acetyltransferase [Chitinophagaceae bacterium]
MTTKENYKKFCESHSDISIFLSWKWINFVCNDFKIFEFYQNGKIAFLILPIEKKIGFTIIRNPLLSPYCGFLFENGFNENEKKLTAKNLLSQIPKANEIHLDFHPDYFISNFNTIKNISTKNTYKLQLIVEEKIYINFKDSLKRQIKKGEKNLTIESTRDINLLYNLYLKSQLKQKNKIIISIKELQKIAEWGFAENCMRIDVVKNEHGDYLAASLLCYDKITSYYLLGGADPNFSNSGAMSYLLWQQIRISIALQKTYFDFEGSMIKGVAKFFSNFGASIYNYNSMQENSSGIYGILKKIKNKIY